MTNVPSPSPANMSTEAITVEIEVAAESFEDARQRYLSVQLAGPETAQQINYWRNRYYELVDELERREKREAQ